MAFLEQLAGGLSGFGAGVNDPSFAVKLMAKRREEEAAKEQQSKLIELAQAGDPKAMMQAGATTPEGLAKYAEYLNLQRKPTVPLTSGLPEGYMWSNGQAVRIPGVEGSVKPLSPQGQLQADYDRGLIDEETYQKSINKAGKTASVPGYDIAAGQMPTADDAKKVKVVATARDRLNTQLTEYEKSLEEYGRSEKGLNIPIVAGSKAAQDLERKQTAMRMTIKELEGLGSLQEGEISELKALLGSPVIGGQLSDFNPLQIINKTASGTNIAKSSIQDVRNYINNRVDSTVKNYGYVPKGEKPASNTPASSGWSIREKK